MLARQFRPAGSWRPILDLRLHADDVSSMKNLIASSQPSRSAWSHNREIDVAASPGDAQGESCSRRWWRDHARLPIEWDAQLRLLSDKQLAATSSTTGRSGRVFLV